MKRLVSWAVLLSLLSGCGGRAGLPYAREMGDTVLMRTVGVDVCGDGVLFTASAGSRGDARGQTVSAAERSLPAAARALQEQGDSYVYFGHVDQMLVGEEQANLGLGELMDYLAREPQVGPGVQLWVVCGGTAAKAMKAAGEHGIARRLEQLGTSVVGCSAARLMSVLARQGSVCLPALGVTSGREEGKPELVTEGYAVLLQGKLVGCTDEETSRGIELMEEKSDGSVTDLKLADDTKVSLTSGDSEVRCWPVFRDGELVGVDVTCRLDARVAQTGRHLKGQELEELTCRLERLLGTRILRALELSQHWNADFLNLKQRMQLARPGKKQVIEAQWFSAFRALELRVEVRVRIEQSGGMMDEAG